MVDRRLRSVAYKQRQTMAALQNVEPARPSGYFSHKYDKERGPGFSVLGVAEKHARWKKVKPKSGVSRAAEAYKDKPRRSWSERRSEGTLFDRKTLREESRMPSRYLRDSSRRRMADDRYRGTGRIIKERKLTKRQKAYVVALRYRK